jgi:hypothetical protein
MLILAVLAFFAGRKKKAKLADPLGEAASPRQ